MTVKIKIGCKVIINIFIEGMYNNCKVTMVYQLLDLICQYSYDFEIQKK